MTAAQNAASDIDDSNDQPDPYDELLSLQKKVRFLIYLLIPVLVLEFKLVSDFTEHAVKEIGILALAVFPNNKIVEIDPIVNPHYSTERITDWAENTVRGLNRYKFNSIDEKLLGRKASRNGRRSREFIAKKFATEEAYMAFVEYYIDSGLYKAIKHSDLIAHSAISGTSFVTHAKRTSDGTRYWKVVVPLILTLEGQTGHTENYKKKVTLIIQQVDIDKDVNGLRVLSYRAK